MLILKDHIQILTVKGKTNTELFFFHQSSSNPPQYYFPVNGNLMKRI